MKKMAWLILLLVILTACSEQDEQPAVMKEETSSQTEEKTPALVEEEMDNDEEKEKLLTFSLEGEKIMVNLEKIPILRIYMQASPNEKAAMDHMDLLPLEISEADEMYLLEFSCQTSSCSYILLDQKEGGRSYLVADLAEFKNAEVSPEQDKLMLLFNRNQQDESYYTSKIAIIDLENWKPLSFEANVGESMNLEFQSPIVSAEWKDNKTVTVSLPDIPEPTKENIQQWLNSNQQTYPIDLNILAD